MLMKSQVNKLIIMICYICVSLNPYFIKSNGEKLLQIKSHSQDFMINADTHIRESGDKLMSKWEINTNENSVNLLRIYVSYSSMRCSISTMKTYNHTMAKEKLTSFIKCRSFVEVPF